MLSLFYDWVKVFQDFDFELPIVSDRAYQNIVVSTGEYGNVVQPRFQHRGSFSTSISIQISGSRITIDGNPSRINRLDNVVGLSSLDACMSVYNNILSELGLPQMTKCTKHFQRQGDEGSKVEIFSDGATFQRIDVTGNVMTGGHSRDYIRGVSTQRYRNSIPRLHTNGFGADWLSEAGNAHLIYAKLYDKANEVRRHTLKKIKVNNGADSPEYKYLLQLIEFLDANGVCRYEQELHSAYLRRHNLRFWGLFKEAAFRDVHEQFTSIDSKLEVESMELESISERLISAGICEGTRAANTTAMYALEWAHGKQFDFHKSQVKTHRARLRKIGIDIKDTYDQSRFSPVYVVKAKRVEVSPLVMPAWYRHADNRCQLQLAS
jgi:hypothetical protein